MVRLIVFCRLNTGIPHIIRITFLALRYHKISTVNSQIESATLLKIRLLWRDSYRVRTLIFRTCHSTYVYSDEFSKKFL